jgi:hypothetical protein
MIHFSNQINKMYFIKHVTYQATLPCIIGHDPHTSMLVAGMLLDQGIFDLSFKKSLSHPQNVALTNSKCSHSISIKWPALSDGATHGIAQLQSSCREVALECN